MKKLMIPVSAGLVVVGSAAQCFAAAVLDFTGVATAITAELSPAVNAALPIAGTLMAVTIGYKLFRRFVK